MESYSAEWSYMIKKPSTQAYKPQEVAKSASCAALWKDVNHTDWYPAFITDIRGIFIYLYV